MRSGTGRDADYKMMEARCSGQNLTSECAGLPALSVLATRQGAGRRLTVPGGAGTAVCSSFTEGPRSRSAKQNISESQLFSGMLQVTLFVCGNNRQRSSSEDTSTP